MTPEKFLKDFLENIPPYKKVEIGLDVAKILEAEFPKIESFCYTCEKEKTFTEEKLKHVILGDISPAHYKTSIHYTGAVVCPTRFSNLSTDKIVLCAEFRCSHCEEKHYYFILAYENHIMKIGQHPSFASLNHKDIEKYKNVLSKYYIEYKQSLSAFSQGMGVASFVYLRRILEDLVEKKFSKLSSKDEKARFVDRLKAVQDDEEIIPVELDCIKNALYTVLSKGVHEYEENECLEIFPQIDFVIQLILDKQLEEKKRLDKIANASKAIQAKASNKNEAHNEE